MDDLTQQISQLLSDPETMRQLQGVLGSLGAGGGQSQPQQSPPPQPEPVKPAVQAGPDLSALSGLIGGADTLAMVGRLAPLLGQLNQEDDSTRLLRALRPLLSEPKRKRIDEAVKILQLMRLLPMLRDLGLPGLLG